MASRNQYNTRVGVSPASDAMLRNFRRLVLNISCDDSKHNVFFPFFLFPVFPLPAEAQCFECVVSLVTIAAPSFSWRHRYCRHGVLKVKNKLESSKGERKKKEQKKEETTKKKERGRKRRRRRMWRRKRARRSTRTVRKHGSIRAAGNRKPAL